MKIFVTQDNNRLVFIDIRGYIKKVTLKDGRVHDLGRPLEDEGIKSVGILLGAQH
jgi:hypothetical protein